MCHELRTLASPQALVRALRAQEGALPEALRRQCLAAGAAMVPALIALLEAGLVEDQAEPEGALFHAVDLRGALRDARAVPILLGCLEHDERLYACLFETLQRTPELRALPLALGTGVGSELRRPLGIAIVGGLLLSQLLTL